MHFMHSYTVPAQHVVVVRDRQTYNFYVIQAPAKDAVGLAANSVVIDRNRPGNNAWLFTVASVKTKDALRKLMVGATEEHMDAVWEVFQGLSG